MTAARLKQTAIAGLVLLTFIALGFGYYASNQRNIAFELFSQSQALVKEIGKAQQETSEALELAKQKAADEDRAKREAERERDRADAQLKKAQMTQSLFLADLARQQRDGERCRDRDPARARGAARYAAGIARPYVPEAEFQLDGAWRDLRERLVLKAWRIMW